MDTEHAFIARLQRREQRHEAWFAKISVLHTHRERAHSPRSPRKRKTYSADREFSGAAEFVMLEKERAERHYESSFRF